ncbi:MAG: hypothetical protein GC139_04670 [Sideroxydans sp.]|nr:hypothetical protein [Sideroxydans sp.]
MAQPNFQFEKRQKELAKKKKQEEKKQRKLAEKAAREQPGRTEIDAGTALHTGEQTLPTGND